jgi:hypothetical protein
MSSLKETGNLDGGTATIVGGTDWDRFVGYFKNKLNQFDAVINSNTEYKFGKLWLRNQSDSASQNLRAGNVTGNFTMTLPSYNANDEIASLKAPQEFENKTIDFSKNTIVGGGGSGGGGSTSSEGKWGLIQAPRNANDGTISQGTLSGHTNVGTTITMDNDPPPAGTHWQYDTDSATNTNAGVRWLTTWLRRDFNPRLRVKYRVPVGPTGAQFLCGLSVDADISATQNPLEDTQSGVLVGYRSTDTNYMVIRNSGTNAQPITPIFDDTANTSVVSKSTSLYRVIDITFSNQGNNCNITISRFNTTPPYALTTEFTKNYTTNLPALTSPGTGGSIYMRPVFQITNKEAVIHTVELFKMELYSDF